MEDFNTQITELKLEMLLKKLDYEIAKENYQKAQEMEKLATDNALAEYNKRNNTTFNADFEIDNDTEFEIFLTDLQKAYKQLGIDTDTHKVYTYNFMKQYVKTAREYALKGIEFLRIANKMTEYMQLKNAIENRTMTFLEIEKLINLHNSFLGEQL